jgi:hypothetical protein
MATNQNIWAQRVKDDEILCKVNEHIHKGKLLSTVRMNLLSTEHGTDTSYN